MIKLDCVRKKYTSYGIVSMKGVWGIVRDRIELIPLQMCFDARYDYYGYGRQELRKCVYPIIEITIILEETKYD